jgi:hypothetical protein
VQPCACNVRAGLEIPFRAVFSRHPDPGDPDVLCFRGERDRLIPMTADELIVNSRCAICAARIARACARGRRQPERNGLGCALPRDQENSFARRMDDMAARATTRRFKTHAVPKKKHPRPKRGVAEGQLEAERAQACGVSPVPRKEADAPRVQALRIL